MNRTPLPDSVRRAALKRDGYACRAPGHPAAPPVGYSGRLEVDHIREQAEFPEGTPAEAVHALSNLMTLCDYCHALKSRERVHQRARAPRSVHQRPAGLVVTQELTARGKPVGPRLVELAPREPQTAPVKGTGAVPPRRHTSHAQFEAACRRREEAIAQGETC